MPAVLIALIGLVLGAVAGHAVARRRADQLLAARDATVDAVRRDLKAAHDARTAADLAHREDLAVVEAALVLIEEKAEALPTIRLYQAALRPTPPSPPPTIDPAPKARPRKERERRKRQRQR